MVSTPLLQVLGIDVAQRDAAAVVDALQVLQQIASAAAGADHAELHLIVRGPDLLDRGSALDDGMRQHRGHRSGGLQHIAAGKIFSCAIRGHLVIRVFPPNCNMQVRARFTEQ